MPENLRKLVSIRQALSGDYELMMAWRSNPDIYQGFYQQDGPLTWEEHIAWLNSRGSTWKILIIDYHSTYREESRRVGVVTLSQLDHWNPEIGYYIGETTLWGKGIATEAISQALEWLIVLGKKYVHTTVLDYNHPGKRVVKKLGFKKTGRARLGESYWQKEI